MANAISVTAPSGAGLVGTTSGWVWTDVEVNIPNEQIVYGGRVFGSGFDAGDFPRILPLFALKASHLDVSNWFWLRAVADTSRFALADSLGSAEYYVASHITPNGGIRSYFLYV